jgi:hypothetical protein
MSGTLLSQDNFNIVGGHLNFGRGGPWNTPYFLSYIEAHHHHGGELSTHAMKIVSDYIKSFIE